MPFHPDITSNSFTVKMLYLQQCFVTSHTDLTSGCVSSLFFCLKSQNKVFKLEISEVDCDTFSQMLDLLCV